MDNTYTIIKGSICLSNIPKDLIRRVKCKDGVERAYLNVAIIPKREATTYQNADGSSRTYTHYISCAPKKEERKDGVKYIIGDLEAQVMGQQDNAPTQQTPAFDPFTSAGNTSNDLPF